MRITGGSLKGRQVRVPPGVIRPAMDKMRESVFAVLGDLTGLSFLDLFSGSGIIALEAASRGAECVEAVESDPRKRNTLLENAQLSPQRINCRFMPVELYIKRYKKAFDVIFCDPPFPYQFKAELVRAICDSSLVKDNTLILLHHPQDEDMTANERLDLWPSLSDEDCRKYGRSVVNFYKIKRK